MADGFISYAINNENRFFHKKMRPLILKNPSSSRNMKKKLIYSTAIKPTTWLTKIMSLPFITTMVVKMHCNALQLSNDVVVYLTSNKESSTASLHQRSFFRLRQPLFTISHLDVLFIKREYKERE